MVPLAYRICGALVKFFRYSCNAPQTTQDATSEPGRFRPECFSRPITTNGPESSATNPPHSWPSNVALRRGARQVTTCPPSAVREEGDTTESPQRSAAGTTALEVQHEQCHALTMYVGRILKR